MSAADAAANIALYGPGASSWAQGFAAFDASYREGLESGKSDKDAFIDALVDGGIEGPTANPTTVPKSRSPG